MAYIRTGLLAIMVAVTGSNAAAGPIYFSAESVSKPAQRLTVEQLALLDELADHGWHLGWFKDNGSDLNAGDVFPDSVLGNVNAPPNGPSDSFPTLLPSGLGPIAQPFDITQSFDNPAGVSAQLTPVPEPGTLLLLGGGIAGIAAKVRKRRIKPTA